MRLANWFTKKNKPLYRCLFKLIVTLVIILFVFGSAQMIFENQWLVGLMRAELFKRANVSNYINDESQYEDINLYKFWDMFYYMVMTLTTVGYGDIYPHTEEGQWLFIIIEISALSALPIAAMDFQKVNNLTSSYSRSTYQ
jgi:NADH:ubiquinone oxidoreductase subunit K